MITTFKEIDTYSFLLLLFSTFFVGGIIIAAFFHTFLNKYNSLTKIHYLLLGIGFSPYLIATLLYYLFLLIPNKTDEFYLTIIGLIYIILFLFSLSSISVFFKNGFQLVYNTFLKRKLVFIILVFFSCPIFVYWGYYINSKLLTEHDTLEYAVQGKVFYQEKAIHYNEHRYDEPSGFYYVGLHGLSFPLLATYERVSNQFLSSDKDYFFRSLNSVFGLLILCSIFIFSFKSKGFYFAFLVMIGLFFSYGFFETIMKYHIDNFRIFYLYCSIFLMVNVIKEYSIQHLVLFGLFLAAQANAHSLGFLLAIIQLGVIFLFINGNWARKIIRTSILFFILLLGGALHYFIDIFMGTGWLFQDVKFY